MRTLAFTALFFVLSAQASNSPILSKPVGKYETLWLTLEGSPKARVFLALRDGKPVQFWSLEKDLPGLPKPSGTPKLLVDTLEGKTTPGGVEAQIQLRLVSIWAPQAKLGEATLALSFQMNGENVNGTWNVAASKVDGAKKANGRVTGKVLSEADSQRIHGFSTGQDWPSFYGECSAMRGPSYGKEIINDLANSEPVWRSEAVSLSGWGTGVDARYKERATLGTLCGGSSSPVAAEGLVYLYHYRPSKDIEPVGADGDLLRKYSNDLIAAEWLKGYFSSRADVVVTCMDGSNGKTVWESVWPQKQGNYQTHKWRSNNPTPSIAKGVLVVADYSWGLHAFDAKTGELLWTKNGGGPIPRDRAAIGPVISGNIVVWTAQDATYGLDLKTGTQLWKAPVASGARRMMVEQKERILLTGPTLSLVEPLNGQQIAQMAFPGGVEKKGKVELGLGPEANLVCDGSYIVSFETTKSGEDTVGSVFALRVVSDRFQLAWKSTINAKMEDGHIGMVIANEHVHTAFQYDGAFCLELATGKVISNLKEHLAHSNPIFAAIDNRIFWQPECQHGHQQIQLFSSGPDYKPLGQQWSPPHNHTTAYERMPIANIVIDGRLILRGMDGLYCYDLRVKK